MAHPAINPERYTFGTFEDGRSRAPVSDGTNRRTPTPYRATYNGKTRASRPWHESNYSTGKRPRKVHTSKKGHRTEVYVPDAHRLHLPSIHTED